MKFRTLDDLPLFADDLAIGAALLGRTRASEWRDLAPLLEARGLPKMDALLGGRYVPAVRAYFDRQYGLVAPLKPAPRGTTGIEDLSVWETRRGGRRRQG
jgi:hypothetical protein